MRKCQISMYINEHNLTISQNTKEKTRADLAIPISFFIKYRRNK